jgi:cytochrome P450 family 142 subfamily A polypeptide 1
MTAVETPYVNLLDPQFYVDPWATYKWLRDESPVHWDPVQRLWGISRYEDVLMVEKDTRMYTSFKGSRPHIDQSENRSMIDLDDPAHQQQRKLVVRRFTPRGVRNHEGRIRALADSIVDEAIADGAQSFEVIEKVASRLPAMVITELLGYAPEQWTLIRTVSETTMHAGGQTSVDGSEPCIGPTEESVAAMTEWIPATMGIMADRRSRPRDDLISVWCHSQTDGVSWDDAKILDEILLVVDGGAETTRTVIGSIVRELALRPDSQRRLREHPELLPIAVEEFIRWVSPVLNMRRTTTRHHELSGQHLREGDEVLLLYASANRDERAFEQPEEFDVARDRNHHVAFGFGTHVCLGAPLARLELQIMFERLLARLPEWRLVPGTEPKVIPSTFARAFDAVHIEF